MSTREVISALPLSIPVVTDRVRYERAKDVKRQRTGGELEHVGASRRHARAPPAQPDSYPDLCCPVDGACSFRGGTYAPGRAGCGIRTGRPLPAGGGAPRVLQWPPSRYPCVLRPGSRTTAYRDLDARREVRWTGR